MSGHGLDDLLTVHEAIAIIDAIQLSPKQIREPVTNAGVAYQTLHRDVVSDRDYPPFDKSLMDGFAVRSADLSSTPAELKLVGEVAAGARGSLSIFPGTCVAIMTGATVPGDADAVVPVEQTIADGERVQIQRVPKPGQAIARKGSDVLAGQIVLEKGTPVGPAQVGALVQVGAIDAVPNALFACESTLRAHVLVTGDEIVDERQTPGTEHMRDANGPMLAAQLSSFGVACTRSRVIDDPARTRVAIDSQARSNDLLFVTGGMSMGKYDYVPRALIDLGFDLRITKLRIKPGKPFVFATRERAEKTDYVFGLPGNPVAGFCCTLRLASRLIARLQGLTPPEPESASLAQPLSANGPREFYQPAILAGANVTPLGWKGSADVFTLARANALIVRSIDEPARAVDDNVSIIRF